MIVQARLHGLQAFEARLRKLADPAPVDKALRDAGEMVRAEAVRRLDEERTPERSSGALAASIRVMPGSRAGTTQVGTDLDHGWFLEFGTVSAAPRPWLGPALQHALPDVREAIAGVYRGRSA